MKCKSCFTVNGGSRARTGRCYMPLQSDAVSCCLPLITEPDSCRWPMAGTRNAGLLLHLRLEGGGGAASPDQRGHVGNEDAVTALFGRAAACLQASAQLSAAELGDCQARTLCAMRFKPRGR